MALDLERNDWLYRGLVTTVTVESDRPLIAWLVSPAERGWFLLRMERWDDLVTWETEHGDLRDWRSRARLAVARHHLGVAEPEREDVTARVTKALPGFAGPHPKRAFRRWTKGLDPSLWSDPRPDVAFDGFHVRIEGRWFALTEGRSSLPAGELPPRAKLVAPLDPLAPGFYRLVCEIEAANDIAPVEIEVRDGDARASLARRTVVAAAGGRESVEVPFRVAPSPGGWNAQVVLENRGQTGLLVRSVKLENDPNEQLRWWLDELRAALGNSDAAS
jgi:hypothetical protein